MTKSLFGATLLSLGLLAFGTTSSVAAGVGSMAHSLKNTPAVRYVVARQATLAPFAHVVFCMKRPKDCASDGGPATVDLDARRLRALMTVNRHVNRTILPVNDAANSGLGSSDDWELAPKKGDCEDFAITKRHRLIAMGWPVGSLRLAVTTTAWGEGHAVLLVHTSRGDLVLDNRSNAIKPFQNTDLHFLKIQSADNPQYWFAV